MRRMTSSAICIAFVCFSFAISTHCITSRAVLNSPSSSFQDTPHNFLSLQETQSAGIVDNDADHKEFREFVLYGNPDLTKEAPEHPLPVWLRVGKPHHPIEAVLAGASPNDEYHAGVFVEGPLVQPPIPRADTTEGKLHTAMMHIIDKYDHEAYFNALITVAHPPPLYEATRTKSTLKENWDARNEAAIHSLLFDAGVPQQVLRNEISFRLRQPHEIDARIAGSKMVCFLSKTNCGDDEVRRTAVTEPSPRPMTYAKVFDAEFAALYSLDTRDEFTLHFHMVVREFAEYVRIRGVLVRGKERFNAQAQAAQDAHKSATAWKKGRYDTECSVPDAASSVSDAASSVPDLSVNHGPLLYALPFEEGLRPKELLKHLYAFLEVKGRVAHVPAQPAGEESRRGGLSGFEEWLERKLSDVSTHSTPDATILKKYADTPAPIVDAFPRLCEKYGLEKWQKEPFEYLSLRKFFYLQSLMAKVLSLATFSHTLLYLRRNFVTNVAGVAAGADVSASSSVSGVTSPKQETIVSMVGGIDIPFPGPRTTHANNVVMLSLAIMVDESRILYGEKKYTTVDTAILTRTIGAGQISKGRYFDGRMALSIALGAEYGHKPEPTAAESIKQAIEKPLPGQSTKPRVLKKATERQRPPTVAQLLPSRPGQTTTQVFTAAQREGSQPFASSYSPQVLQPHLSHWGPYVPFRSRTPSATQSSHSAMPSTSAIQPQLPSSQPQDAPLDLSMGKRAQSDAAEQASD